MPIQDIDVTKYFAPVSNTADPTIKVVDFPAVAQMHQGVYKLVIIAQVMDPGYKYNNRTVTIDYNDLFELVDSSADVTDDEISGKIISGSVELDITSPDATIQPPVEPTNDVYVVSGQLSGNNLRLHRSDNSDINIDVSPNWYEGD